MLSTKDALKIKNAATCPACGAVKHVGAALCLKCRDTLTPEMRTRMLFARQGGEMERALEESIRCAKLRRQPASAFNAGRHTRED
mgnify:CR=1 FL=1